MIKAGIIGGAGYTAGELIRIILNHPGLELDFVYSTSNAGNKIYHIHSDLIGETEMEFSQKINTEIDILFLCLGHGNSKAFMEANKFSADTRIIDLSNDFRLTGDSCFKGQQFVYGLPEVFRHDIQKATYLANPGCFATAIQLALLPLAAKKMLNTDIHVNAVTGATGAGVSLSKTTHFTWRDNNFSHYKAFDHQHLGEINQTLGILQTGFDKEVIFIPNRGNFSRGIFATVYTDFDGSVEEASSLYNAFYKDAVFTHVSTAEIFLKQVVNTNKCLIHLKKHKNKLLITTAIDNLLKGASGQAIQNMNIMFGLEEDLGLSLKANFF
ncbi:N-acetyl-gamma-glutamyl-phosphate reductase [Lutimonas zeaxanthinifaciens]|uniref:N-acetyl-gamma-glutamyl-phosphate reductase n=1 Tax=Lutimonas zeaxanthinifaciens TaxID=3060215 RepID=UPI00265D099E|nr:N-acetyl-gamma-glutamyl-phosphate reductase [Lutimonas sp. YSD2104]WKK65521.1 N-acetyl-gamma-glutamyl-phosphate reductase [Lutimonas sp. YSD2104]